MEQLKLLTWMVLKAMDFFNGRATYEKAATALRCTKETLMNFSKS